MSDQPCADSPPASQNTADCTRSENATISDVVAAPNSDAIAIPARISRPIPPPRGPDHAIENTSAAASTPNTSAPTGSSATEAGNISRIRIAPNAAPPVTPITSGEASGLASAPCSIAPATPSAAPTTAALTVRGRRSWSTISFSGPGSARPVRAATTSWSGTWTAPSVSDARGGGHEGRRRHEEDRGLPDGHGSVAAGTSCGCRGSCGPRPSTAAAASCRSRRRSRPLRAAFVVRHAGLLRR